MTIIWRKKETNEQAYLNPVTEEMQAAQTPVSDGKADWQTQKEEQARLRKIQNQIRKIEDEIEALEERAAQIQEEFSRPEVATNSAKLGELHNEQVSIQERLEILYENWEKLGCD